MEIKLSKGVRYAMIAAALLAGEQSVSAFSTPDELVSYLQKHIITQCYATGPWVEDIWNKCDYGYGGAEIETTDDGKLTFKNFYMPGLNVEAEISTVTYDWGCQLYINIALDKVYHLYTGYSSKYTPSYEGKYAKLIPMYTDPNDQWSQKDCGTTTIDGKTYAYVRPSEDASEKTYSFEFTYGSNYALRSNGSSNGLIIAIYNDEACTDLVDVKSFVGGRIVADDAQDINAVASDYDRDGNLIRTYKMSYFSNGSSYGFYNLNALGASINLGGVSSSNITVNDNGKEWDGVLHFNGLNVPVTVVNNSVNFNFEGYCEKEGISAYWFSYDKANRTTLDAVSEGDKTHASGTVATNMEVFGSYGPNADFLNHNHSTTNCPWVTNDGNRATFSEKEDIYFYDYGLAYHTNSNSEIAEYEVDDDVATYYEEYSYTRISWDGKSGDYTLGVDLNIDAFGETDNREYIYVKGSIVPNKNTDFVDHYELCIKPGKKVSVADYPYNSNIPFNTTTSEASDDDTSNDYRFAENGYPGGTSLYGIGNMGNGAMNASSIRRVAASAEASEDASETIEFEKLVPTSALKGVAETAKDYSFYVKAVYKDEYVNDSASDPGLNPTYHNAVVFEGIYTGVESVANSSNDAIISGGNGEINVLGDVNSISVYSISGAEVYSGSEKTISVPSGIYIVKAGNTVAKVVVK